MRRDPLGIYARRRSNPPPAKQSSSGFGGNLLTILLIAAVAFLAYDRFRPDDGEGDDRRDDDRQEQVDQFDQVVVFVHERKPLAIEHSLLLDQVREAEINYRSIDDDDPAWQWLLDWAAAKDVNPPMAVFASRLEGEAKATPRKVIPFPTDVDAVKELIQ